MDNLKEPKKKLKSLGIKALVVLAIVTTFSFFYDSPKIILGIVIGGLLSLGNLLLLTRVGESVFQQEKSNKTPIILAYIIKMVLLFGLLYFLITRNIVDILAFVIGFSSIFIALGIEIIFPPRPKSE